ncbi:MAG: SPOR domain-containing protein [Sulfurimonas sp.]|jgi:DedD protein|nr:SPOR domain-containing protein [Sulfurimonadaceae bacterium]
MNEETNELSDIKLQRDNPSSGNKKILLSVATLGAILLITIIIINSISSKKTDNLPKRVPPLEPTKELSQAPTEPLFEDVEVEEDSSTKSISLDEIAKKLKEKSAKAEEQIEESKPEAVVEKPVQEAPKVEAKKPTPPQPKAETSGSYYVQIGSFERVKPAQRILDATTKLGYSYSFYEVELNGKKINKVLVGPFNSQKEAKDALPSIKNSVEKNAFLFKK